MKATLSLALASCLSCCVASTAPAPRAGDVIIEDTDDDQTPNPGAEDKAAKRVRFVSLSPDILYEVDPSRYVENPRTLAGAQLFYGARSDLLGAKVACVAPYDPVWRQELAEKKKSIVWGRLDNLWPVPAKLVAKDQWVFDFWARPSTSFYAWRHPQNAQKIIAIDFALWKNWTTTATEAVKKFTYKEASHRKDITAALDTGRLNTTQHSFETCPWKDMLERGKSGNTVSDYVADADRVRTWQTAVNKSGRTIRAPKLPWTDDWVEHATLYNQKGTYHQKKRAAEINWGETFYQTLNESIKLYDGFLCLKDDASLIDVKKNTPADHSRVVPFDAQVKWSGYVKTVDKGKEVMQEKVYLESDIAKAVVISDKNASPDFVVLAVACDCIKGDSAEDAITILKAFRGEEVAVAEYIAEGTVSGTGSKNSPLTYATGIGYAKGTGTGNLVSFTVKNPENLRYNRSVARLRSEETAAAYKAGITPRYKILFAVKEALAADPAKLTLTGDATKTRSADGKPAALEENEGGDSLNGYTYVNMAVPLKSATNITPVGSGSIELFRLPLPRAKYRLFQADVQAEKALERDIRMGFMDYTWTLRAESTELGKDSSRIGRVFAVFGESTLKQRTPDTSATYSSWRLLLSGTGREKCEQYKIAISIPGLKRELTDAERNYLLRGSSYTWSFGKDAEPAISFIPDRSQTDGVASAEYTMVKGKDYEWVALSGMKEQNTMERPWIDALEALTRHLLLETKLKNPIELAVPSRPGETPPPPEYKKLEWPTNAAGAQANAVSVFSYGLKTMGDYNLAALEKGIIVSTVLQYRDDRYFLKGGHATSIDLPQCTRRLCGGDHPVIICEEGVALIHSLLSLCGMEYGTLSRMLDTKKGHALLGHGNRIYDPTPSYVPENSGLLPLPRADSRLVDYEQSRYVTLYDAVFETPKPHHIMLHTHNKQASQ